MLTVSEARANSCDSGHSIKTSPSNVRPVSQRSNRVALPNAPNELLRIKVDTDGIRGESRRQHIRCRVVVVGEDVVLSLEDVAIRIVIVQTDGQAMVDAPERRDAFGLALAVGQE